MAALARSTNDEVQIHDRRTRLEHDGPRAHRDRACGPGRPWRRCGAGPATSTCTGPRRCGTRGGTGRARSPRRSQTSVPAPGTMAAIPIVPAACAVLHGVESDRPRPRPARRRVRCGSLTPFAFSYRSLVFGERDPPQARHTQRGQTHVLEEHLLAGQREAHFRRPESRARPPFLRDAREEQDARDEQRALRPARPVATPAAAAGGSAALRYLTSRARRPSAATSSSAISPPDCIAFSTAAEVRSSSSWRSDSLARITCRHGRRRYPGWQAGLHGEASRRDEGDRGRTRAAPAGDAHRAFGRVEAELERHVALDDERLPPRPIERGERDVQLRRARPPGRL